MSKKRLPKVYSRLVKFLLLLAGLAILFPILCEWHCQASR